MHEFVGTHVLSEFYGIQKNLACKDIPTLIELVKESCKKSKVNIVDTGVYVFENGGYTLFFLLKESHISVHTYIEFRTAFIDIFTCGNADAKDILANIEAYFSPTKITTNHLVRGRV